jgi:hypothetical protein
MKTIKKFNENVEEQTSFSEDKPYIVLMFDISLSEKSKGDEYILKSQPIWDMKKIKIIMQRVQWQNNIWGRQIGKVIQVEKHNFTKWEDLPINWK